jgi:hypothetical protein
VGWSDQDDQVIVQEYLPHRVANGVPYVCVGERRAFALGRRSASRQYSLSGPIATVALSGEPPAAHSAAARVGHLRLSQDGLAGRYGALALMEAGVGDALTAELAGADPRLGMSSALYGWISNRYTALSLDAELRRTKRTWRNRHVLKAPATARNHGYHGTARPTSDRRICKTFAAIAAPSRRP